jgi:ABC-2 type transport system permease protein
VNALRSEWTKLRTSPGTVWLLLCVVVTTAGVSIFSAAVTTCPARGCVLDPARVSLTGVTLGQAVAAILGVLVVGTEYATGTIRLTLAAVPRRLAVLAAKAAVVTATMVAAAVPAVAVSLVAGRNLLPGNGFPALDLGSGPMLRAAVGSVAYLTLIALLSLGIATLVRDSATAIGVVLALLYVFPIVALTVSDPDVERHLKQVSPTNAGLAVQATQGLDDLPIGPWQGLAVLAAWAAGSLLVAGCLLLRRDA